MSNQVSLFVREVTARIKGDKAEVIAVQNEKKAGSAIKSQIAQQESSLVDAESAVETAQDKLNTAMFPSERIEDNSGYLRGITRAQENLDAANESVKTIQDSITFFKRVQSKFNSLVDAA